MKLLFFDDFKLGVLKGDAVVDVSDAVKDIPHTGPHNLISGLIERFDGLQGSPGERGRPRSGASRVSQVKIRPPIPKPYNIVCDGRELHGGRDALRARAHQRVPQVAQLASSATATPWCSPTCPPPSSRARPRWRSSSARSATNVSAGQAMSYVFGYMNFIDGSARGLPPERQHLLPDEVARHASRPMGPYIVTADEIPDPHRLQVKLWVNGTLKQNYNTSDMAHKIPRCIEWVTSIHSLDPGDVIATGTNHRGLSGFQNGDRIEIETEGLGALRFNIARRPQAHLGPRDATRPAGEEARGHHAAADRKARTRFTLVMVFGGGRRSMPSVASSRDPRRAAHRWEVTR